MRNAAPIDRSIGLARIRHGAGLFALLLVLSVMVGCGTSRFQSVRSDRSLGDEASLYAFHMRSHGQDPGLSAWHLRVRRSASENWALYGQAFKSQRSGLSVVARDLFLVMLGPYSFDELRETLDQF